MLYVEYCKSGYLRWGFRMHFSTTFNITCGGKNALNEYNIYPIKYLYLYMWEKFTRLRDSVISVNFPHA